MANGRAAAVNVFDALGDPMRRAILERLSERPLAVGDLAGTLPVGRPAVSQHLRILKDAQLVSETAEGTRRIYRIDPRGIASVREWLDSHWGQALDAFKAFADAGSSSEHGPPG